MRRLLLHAVALTLAPASAPPPHPGLWPLPAAFTPPGAGAPRFVQISPRFSFATNNLLQDNDVLQHSFAKYQAAIFTHNVSQCGGSGAGGTTAAALHTLSVTVTGGSPMPELDTLATSDEAYNLTVGPVTTYVIRRCL